METRSRKRLKLDNSLANNYQEDEVQNVTNSNPRLNRNQPNFDNKMDIADMVKLYENGEFTQEMFDQALSVQERFIYFYLSTTLNRAISFLFKSELTKIVDIRNADKMKCYSALMIYYKRAPIIFPQILAQLCPNIIDFRKMNQSNVSHVAFLNEYKKNIPKYSETGLEYIPENKFSAYIHQFAQTMPHLIEMMISKVGVDGIKAMMEAFSCEQETIDSIFNLVKEFKIKIDDTYCTNRKRNQKIEETIALLLKCPNTKTVDISLVTKNREKESYSSPIIKFFNSMPSSFTQAFAQLCPRIEQIVDNGDFIFDSQLFSSYARGTNGRCNLSHVNLIRYRNLEMQRQKLQYYVDCCYKIKSLEISFSTCKFLIEGSSLESNKNFLEKLKHVEDMKLDMGYAFRINNIDFVKKFLLVFTELKHLDLKLYFRVNHNVRDIFTTINSLPSLTCLDLEVYYINCLEFIRPSLINKLCICGIQPGEIILLTNLNNLQSLTLIWAHNNIIPVVRQLKLSMLFNLKHLKIKFFDGDRKKLFSAANALSRNIKFDFYEDTSWCDVIRDAINARHTIFNKISLQCNVNNDFHHANLHKAITKLDSSRVREAVHLVVGLPSMKIVQKCEGCAELLSKNTIFHIYKK